MSLVVGMQVHNWEEMKEVRSTGLRGALSSRGRVLSSGSVY